MLLIFSKPAYVLIFSQAKNFLKSKYMMATKLIINW